MICSWSVHGLCLYCGHWQLLAGSAATPLLQAAPHSWALKVPKTGWSGQHKLGHRPWNSGCQVRFPNLSQPWSIKGLPPLPPTPDTHFPSDPAVSGADLHALPGAVAFGGADTLGAFWGISRSVSETAGLERRRKQQQERQEHQERQEQQEQQEEQEQQDTTRNAEAPQKWPEKLPNVASETLEEKQYFCCLWCSFPVKHLISGPKHPNSDQNKSLTLLLKP